MLRLYKISDSTVFKQKETGLGTSLRYFRAPAMQASHSITVKIIQILKGCIKSLKLVGNQVNLCFYLLQSVNTARQNVSVYDKFLI